MTGRKPCVLVVDDDPVARQLIQVNLQLEGFEVATAEDGQDCLERIRGIDPDVVTLDVIMPRLDGWTTAARMRADPDLARIPIVFLTARAQSADVRRGASLGAGAYLTKPFDPEALLAAVRRLATAGRELLG